MPIFESEIATYPFLFRSMMPGVKWWTYVLVQINSRMTSRRDLKLKSAD